MSDLDAKVERLKAEATKRWGEYWAVRVQHFADDETNAIAFRSRGRNYGQEGYRPTRKTVFTLSATAGMAITIARIIIAFAHPLMVTVPPITIPQRPANAM